MRLVNIHVICRICLVENKVLNNLFSTTTRGKSLCEKLFECTSIIVAESDVMPKNICEACTKRLISLYQFRLLCQTSEEKLRQFLLDNAPACENQAENDTPKTFDSDVSVKTAHPKINNQNALQIQILGDVTKENYLINASSSNVQNYVLQNNDECLDKQGLMTTDSKKEEENGRSINDIKKNPSPEQVSGIESEKPIYKKKQCQMCGKMTTGLKLHVLSHLGIKDYKCEYCGKAFVQRIQYQRHLNIHTGNKPFVCSLCGKAFADSTSLRCHNVTHTKEKKYKCDICEKSFGYSHTLTAHKRTHTQDRKHICAVCDRPFLTKHGLKKHTRVHTGEKPYKCDFCDKRFSTTGNIQTHRRIHTRERPYKCNTCEMSFSYKSVLNSHIKTHIT